METTPAPNLRHPEWVVKLVVDPLTRRNRLRTVKWALTLLLTAAAGGMFKEVAHVVAMRLDWEPPPGRSGEILPGADGRK